MTPAPGSRATVVTCGNKINKDMAKSWVYGCRAVHIPSEMVGGPPPPTPAMYNLGNSKVNLVMLGQEFKTSLSYIVSLRKFQATKKKHYHTHKVAN